MCLRLSERRRRFVTPFVLTLVCGWIQMEASGEVQRRLPEVFNPHPLSGRLYPQLIDPYAGQILDGMRIEASFASASVYERHFHGTSRISGTNALTSNHTVYSLRMGYGLPAPLEGLELGGVLRSYRDEKRTWLARFLEDFHDWTDGFANGHSPPPDQYHGTLEEGGISFIGEDGERFMNTLELYAKARVLEDGQLPGMPGITLSFGFRPPLSDEPFDRVGAGASLGFSKRLGDSFELTGAASLTYLDLQASDFAGTNVFVNRTSSELFVGATWDCGEPGGWYLPFGLRHTSERIDLLSNRTAANGSVAFHLSVVYARELESGGLLEFAFAVNEDIPQWSHALDPDFVVHTGLAYTPASFR